MVSTPVHCPICSVSFPSNNLLRSHLLQLHSTTEIFNTDTNSLTQRNLHLCQHCNDSVNIYLSAGNLQRHIKTKHPIQVRTKSNLELITEVVKPDAQNTFWADALTFLMNTIINKPPPFRRTAWSKLTTAQKRRFTVIYDIVVTLIIKASATPTSDLNRSESSPTPFWKLFFIIEAIILTPNPPEFTAGTYLANRIDLFYKGNIRQLFFDAYSYKQPTRKSSKPTVTQIQSYIQHALNNDDYKKAMSHLKTMPVATITDANIHIIEKLYPDALPLLPDTSTRNTRSTSSRLSTIQLNMIKDLCSTKKLLISVNTIKRGKAPGPFADSQEVLKWWALTRQDNNSYPNIEKLSQFIQLIMTDKFPTELQNLFGSNILICLHKSETDPTKLRPIGLGLILRRFISSHIARFYVDTFKSYLNPYQYGIGTRNGMEFIINSCTTTTQAYITRNSENIESNPPTRVLISLDLTNMFNACNRRQLLHIVRHRFPELYPYFKLSYDNSNLIHFQKGLERKWSRLLQHDGCTQGDPLGVFFAAAIFHDILKPLDSQLRQRAYHRKHSLQDRYDDDQGGVSDLTAWVDDLCAAIPYPDLKYTIQFLQKHGPPLGLHLSLPKCKFLTSTNSNSPYQFLPPAHQQTLQWIRTTFGEDSEVTDGIRILGAPIGNPNFCTNFQSDTITNIRSETKLLEKYIPDPQSRLTLFRHCINTRANHLLAADARSQPSESPFSSPFSSDLQKISTNFLKNLLHLDTLPEHALQIASLNIISGGLGLTNPFIRAPIFFVSSMINTIRSSSFGFPTTFKTNGKREHFTIPSSLTKQFSDWQTSDLPIFTHF